MRAPDSAEVLARFNERLELVELIARKMARSVGARSEQDELVAAGREGLLDAARRFEPTRGVPFGAYATYRIRGAINDWIRKSVEVPRRAHERLLALEAASAVNEGEAAYAFRERATLPARSAAEAHLAEHLGAVATAATLTLVAAADNPEEAFARAEFLAHVQRALDQLPAEAAAVVRRHYLDGERLEDIARELAVSKSWVTRLLTRTTARLARRLRADT